jgi:hypothetical protein
MDKLLTLTYDSSQTNGPGVDDFMVSIGRKGIGSIYHVAESRKVKTRTDRYVLRVFKADDLKANTRIVVSHRWVRWGRRWQVAKMPPSNRWGRRKTWGIKVREVYAWPMFWYSRNEKQ